MPDASHKVLKLWIRPADGCPLEERDALTVESGRGIVGDHTFGRLRHVTLVFEDDWNAAARAIGKDVDPIGRRANVLVSGGGGVRYLGSTIRLGDVTLEIKGITEPCPVMDRAAPGMTEALKPEGRAGIWGRAVRGGTVRCNDSLELNV